MKETPEVPRFAPETWANVDDFGADPTGEVDSAAAIQRAIDSGATTIVLPGSYNLRKTVTIRGKVHRLVGLGGEINYGKGLRPDFRLLDGDAPVVFIEHFAIIHGGLEVATRRTLVLRSVQDCDLTSTARAEGAERFFEDVVTHHLQLNRQKLWAWCGSWRRAARRRGRSAKTPDTPRRILARHFDLNGPAPSRNLPACIRSLPLVGHEPQRGRCYS